MGPAEGEMRPNRLGPVANQRAADVMRRIHIKIRYLEQRLSTALRRSDALKRQIDTLKSGTCVVTGRDTNVKFVFTCVDCGQRAKQFSGLMRHSCFIAAPTEADIGRGTSSRMTGAAEDTTASPPTAP